MPSIVLKQFSNPEANREKSITESPNPLSFLEWTSVNYGIVGNDSDKQYQNYLLNWYSQKETSETTSTLKEDYKSLLKKLSIVFRNDADFAKIASLDLDDDLQLKIAVPYYVKKLKEIALYYRDKRDSVKKSKLKYNMIGSLNAVERTFYEYILKAFSKRDYILNVPSQSAWNMFPDLSSVNSGFSIEVEELYDDADYFDISEEDTFSYDVSSTNPLIFLLEEYINSEFGASVISEVPLSALQIPIPQDSEVGIYTVNLQSIHTANEIYGASDKFLLSGGAFKNDEYELDITFKLGDNFFYWFSGENYYQAPDENYLDIAINDLPWIESGAVAGDTYSASDVVFVNYNGDIKGAWLSRLDNVVVEDTMGVNLRNNKEFRYPYPGIGVSAEGLEWTGKQVSEFDAYTKSFFPNQSDKNKVEKELTKLYWNSTDSVSTVEPIRISETSLIDSGAFASSKFHLADKLITRIESEDPDIVDSHSVEWLYDFNKTQIPVTKGENKIYWPLQRYDDYTEININYDSGETMYLSDIPIEKFYGAVAGEDIYNSDIIYKYDSKCGEPIEAAWLQGTSLTVFNTCVNVGSGTLVEVGGGNITPRFTPYKVPSLKHWWIIDKVKSRKVTQVNPTTNERRRVSEFTNWVDIISKEIMSPDDRRSRPLIEQGNIVFSEQLLNVNFKNYNENSYNVNDAIKWDNAGRPITGPYTVAIAFRHRLPNEAHRHTLMETDTRVDSRRISIDIKNNKVVLESGGTKIINPKKVNTGQWHYCIAIFDGANSKLIVDDVEKLGNLRVNPLAKLLIGQSFSQRRQFIGDVRDIIIFKSALSIEQQDGLMGYMSGLTSIKIYRPPITPQQIKVELETNNLELSGTFEDEEGLTIGNFVSGAIQPGIVFKATPREYSRFLWTGNGPIIDSGNLNITKNSAFQGRPHDRACKYFSIDEKLRISPSDKSKTNNQWKDCDCQAIQYSPLGHTGGSYRDGVDIGDFIILDSGYPAFKSLEDWRGKDGQPWYASEDFGWFKLDEDQIDGSVGWGTGRWITNFGDDMVLKPGEFYLYYRSGFNVSCEAREEFGYDEPFFVLNHANCGCQYLDCECNINECGPIWRKAQLINGEWVGLNSVSDLRLESGKFYSYVHKDKIGFAINISEDEIYSDCVKSGNFILGIDIEGSAPYWAKGTFDYGVDTKLKGMMYAGERSEIQFEYLPITQPIPSTLLLTDDLFIKYERNNKCSTDCFVWEQPLTFKIDVENIAWKTLHIDTCIESDILQAIQNVGCESCKAQNKKCASCCEAEKLCGCVIDNCLTTRVGVSASTDLSDIVFKTSYNSEPVNVNYNAKGAFTLPLTVTNTTNGVAPTGGIWVEPELLNFTEVKSPWRNIPNIYHPMIAVNESGELYGIKDCGFFTPSKLGYTNLILNDKVIGLNDSLTRLISANDIILDPNHYVSGPYTVNYTDSTWMKHRSNCISGQIKNSIEYQQFSPYQSTYESLKYNDFGIQRQSDVTSPWAGNRSDEFIDPTNYPANIKGNYPIYCGDNSWVGSQPNIVGDMVVWKTDVYGNQYGLYKELSTSTLYEKISGSGKLWIRDMLDNTNDTNTLISRVIDTYNYITPLINDLTGSGIINFDVVYDTLILQTANYIVIEKINLSFDDGVIYSIADNSHIIEVDFIDFGGYWINESEKTISFGYLSSGVPIISRLDIDSSKIEQLFSNTSDLTEWDISVTHDSKPQFTYNFDNDTYNITFLGLSGVDPVIITSNFEFEDSGYNLNIRDVKVINEPNSSNKKIVKTAAYENSLLMVFEEESNPNKIYQIVIDN